ncbi:Uncharacterised protein [Vibrio cholerae]|nr:Uncharacterised protein [Vibrio cholerae]
MDAAQWLKTPALVQQIDRFGTRAAAHLAESISSTVQLQSACVKLRLMTAQAPN